jgi:uncharacterized surface protein with fasciclin (FAS1) repeats
MIGNRTTVWVLMVLATSLLQPASCNFFHLTGIEKTFAVDIEDSDDDDFVLNRNRGGSHSKRKCRTITDIICDDGDFSLLCGALELTGLDSALDKKNSVWTLFAPTDEAFESLDGQIADEVFTSVENLEFVLLYHVISGVEVGSQQLVCTQRTIMANTKETRTVCSVDQIFQKGAGNSNQEKPEIVKVDIEACNGIVHVVDRVILPKNLPGSKPVKKPTAPSKPTLHPTERAPTRYPTPYPVPRPEPEPEPYYPEPKDNYYEPEHPDDHNDRHQRGRGFPCVSVGDLICQTGGLNLLCEAYHITGLFDSLQVGFEWTVFAPTNEAIESLINSVPKGTLNADNMADLLLFQMIETSVIEISDMRCEEWIMMSDGGYSYTHCRGLDKYQIGPGNGFEDSIILLRDSPIVLREDIGACNGIVHTVDTVLLPNWWTEK